MSKMQIFTEQNGLFTLEYPRTWETEVFGGLPAFYDALGMGNGALQFFAVKLDALEPHVITASPFLKGNDLTEKMALFLEAQDIPYSWEKLVVHTLNEQQVIAHEYHKEGRFFMVAMFERNNTFVLSLYNCLESPPEEEVQIIAAILRSLRLAS